MSKKIKCLQIDKYNNNNYNNNKMYKLYKFNISLPKHALELIKMEQKQIKIVIFKFKIFLTCPSFIYLQFVMDMVQMVI